MPPEDNQALSDNMIAMVAHMETSNKFLEALVESNEKAKKIAEESKKTAATTAKSIPAIAFAVNSINSQIKSAFNSVVKIQEKGLARGMRLDETLKQSSTSVLYLNENLTGYTNALNIGFEMYESGARGNNKALARLALSTKATGGNSLKLVKQLTSLNAGLDLSQDQQTRLNNSILSLSQNFGMSTEELVGAMGGLKSEMMNYAALGVGAQMQESTATLAAMLGPEMADSAAKFATALTAGGGIMESSMLETTEFRKALGTEGGANSGTLIQAVLKSSKSMQKLLDSNVLGSGDNWYAQQNLNKFTGAAGSLSIAMEKQLRQEAREAGFGNNLEAYAKQTDKQIKINKDFKDSWSNLKEKFWNPIQVHLTKFMNLLAEKLLPFLDKNMPFLQAVVGLVAALVTVKTLMKFFGATSGLASLFGGAGGATAVVGSKGILVTLGIFAAGMALLAGGIALVLIPIKSFVPYLERLVNSINTARFGKLFELAKGLGAVGKAGLSASLAIPTLLAVGFTADALSPRTPSSSSLGQGEALSLIHSELQLQTQALNNLVIGQDEGNETREAQSGDLKNIKNNSGLTPSQEAGRG